MVRILPIHLLHRVTPRHLHTARPDHRPVVDMRRVTMAVLREQLPVDRDDDAAWLFGDRHLRIQERSAGEECGKEERFHETNARATLPPGSTASLLHFPTTRPAASPPCPG